MPFLNGNGGAFIVREPIPKGSLHTMSVMPSPEQVAILALAPQIWMVKRALVASRGNVSGDQWLMSGVVVVVAVWEAPG